MTIPLVLLAAVALMADAPATASPTTPSKVCASGEIASAAQFELHSKVNGRAYLVKIALPDGLVPAGGFPVLYVLDGDAFFGSFAEAVRERAGASEIAPAIIVGITYPQDRYTELRRSYDFTPAAPSAYEQANIPDISKGAEFGGAAAFYNVIEQEIIPRVAKLAPVNRHKTVLFGWSLAGLFVLHTMFEHPDAFQSYAALSPSIWWNAKAVLIDEPAFAKR